MCRCPLHGRRLALLLFAHLASVVVVAGGHTRPATDAAVVVRDAWREAPKDGGGSRRTAGGSEHRLFGFGFRGRCVPLGP